MEWLRDLFRGETVTQAVLVLSLVSASGLMLGSIRFFGVSLGFAGVLFSGLIFGHFKVAINPHVLEFAREFGLILFVYTIGIQVGPGFFSSLRRHGLPLNLMAASIVILGMIVATLAWYFGGFEASVIVGLFSGATTNTPSLGAAQQALKEIQGLPEGAANFASLGYAVAYPFGILGVIMTMGLIRKGFRVKLDREIEELERDIGGEHAELEVRNLEVKNANLDGLLLKRIPGLEESGVLISRVLHGGKGGVLRVAQADTVIHFGDILLAVGKPEGLDKLRIIVGTDADLDLRSLPSNIASRRLMVTRKEVVGKTPRQLDLHRKYGVTLTRIIRADMEFTPTSGFSLQFGDRVVAVGEEQSIQKVATELGNSVASLNHPHIVPIFVGIVLGVIVGSFPMRVPGAPAALKLGIAGGPLIVAILLSRLGNFRSLIWYMPASANFMLRELGILLFLACVGLKAGDQFVATLVNGDGFRWMGVAALITVIPIATVGVFARAVMKLNYVTLCGLLAGSMTDPPALAFANAMSKSEGASVSYATVYPLTMLMRVIGAQILVFLLTS